MKKIYLLLFIAISISLKAQQDSTTIQKNLDVVEIISKKISTKGKLEEVDGYIISAGKKSDVIHLDKMDANLSNNNMRQILARVPGINIWESEGNGIQIGISTRGLSPNRSWEFNIRQNGYDIAADPLGYPEAYYNPPMNAVSEIQILRGASGIQYGTQFGGMVNYKLKQAPTDKKIVLESKLIGGSKNMMNSFIALSGTVNKFSYVAYYDYRRGDGWRKNSSFHSHNAHLNLAYIISPKLKFNVEATYSTQLSQQAGGLTDSLFQVDARQSLRKRNWISTPWFVSSVGLEYKINEQHQIQLKTMQMISERSSIGNINPITSADVITNNTYSNRTINQDFYKNFATELRYIGNYKIGKSNNYLSAGLRYFNGNTKRVKGKGDKGTQYSLNYVDKHYSSAYNFNNNNVALFAENIFKIGKFNITPGIRYEYINSKTSGEIAIYSKDSSLQAQSKKANRSVVIMGLSVEYHAHKNIEIYTNFSQAYRPITFSDITQQATTDSIDSNMKDAKGWNLDLGIRGKINSYVVFDISGYIQCYNNRVGSFKLTDNSIARLYRTNVGNSRTAGLESYIELLPFAKIKDQVGDLSFFTSISYTHARYTKLLFNTTGKSEDEKNLAGNKVEYAPDWICRAGLSYAYKGFSATLNYTYTDAVYADASNTMTPTSNGQAGIIPSYNVVDLALGYKLKNGITFKGGINNLTNARYFTRRAGGYPGPGILPSDGRTFFVGMEFKFGK
jgi:Fe(3+) dicitrate transport protein